MSFMTLRPKQTEARRLDLFGIVPNRLNDLPLSDIGQLPIRVDDRPCGLGEYFEVTEGERDTLLCEGDFSKCDAVGGGLENGAIIVEGGVGDHLADRMTGGSVRVSGSAEKFACSSLRGGVVEVNGNCGEYAAAAAPGAKRGMNGGVLVVHGDCDQWLGTRMRRGTVIVHGNVAAGAASRMIAGTLVLCGEVASPLAAYMARGTILMLSRATALTAPAGFTDPEHTELSYLKILLNEIAPYLPKHVQQHGLPTDVYRSLGDRVNRGLGEIIWVNAAVEAADSHVAHA